MPNDRNGTIKISNVKNLLSMFAMFLLTIENFTDYYLNNKSIFNLPILVNFMVFVANAYEDNDKWIMIISILGCLTVSAFGLLKNRIVGIEVSIEFLILGIETLIIFIFYCCKLAKK